MTIPRLLILSTLMLILSSFEVSAQCAGKIEIQEKGVTTAGLKYVNVKIQSEGNYEVSLVKAGTQEYQEIVVETRAGSGNQVFKFNNLSGKDQFRIAVKFESESREICKNRKTDYIVFTK